MNRLDCRLNGPPFRGVALLAAGLVLVVVFASQGSSSEGAPSWKPTKGPLLTAADEQAPDSPTSPLRSHSATALPNGKVLVILGNSTPAARLYDPVGDSWSRAPALSRALGNHLAVALQDGGVLVAEATAGEWPASEHPVFAAVYDPKASFWKPAAPGAQGPFDVASLTLLEDGVVLAVGGYRGHANLTTASLYNPASNNWSATGSLIEGRVNHTATRLEDGSVLVAGGRGPAHDASLNTAELYTPATGTWQTLPHLLRSERAYHAGTLLKDGEVLLSGGSILVQGPHRSKELLGRRAVQSSAEVYDAAARSFKPAPSMRTPRRSQGVAFLRDGRVLAAGGIDDSGPPTPQTVHGLQLRSAEIYEPTKKEWMPSAPLPFPAESVTLTPLYRKPCGGNCGKILAIASGRKRAGAYLFSPAPPGAIHSEETAGRPDLLLPIAAGGGALAAALLILGALKSSRGAKSKRSFS